MWYLQQQINLINNIAEASSVAVCEGHVRRRPVLHQQSPQGLEGQEQGTCRLDQGLVFLRTYLNLQQTLTL